MLFLTGALNLHGQDQHFTQFYASPLALNPALSGAFDGKYRVSMIYRDQGRNLLDEPWTTFGAAVDLRFGLDSYKKNRKDAFGVGILFFNDRNRSSNFFTNQIQVAGAFHKSLSNAGNHYLSGGLQLGIAQRNVNYGSITFSDQFNGLDGYTDPTGEDLPENNFSFFDMNIGVNYTYAPRNQIGIYAGAALHHVLEPQVSFYNTQENEADQNDNTLFQKYSAHIGLTIPMGERVQLLPRALVYLQGPHLAANAGTNFRFLLDDIQGTALHVGGWVRPVRSVDDEFGLDAVVGMVGLEYSNFLIGFSYDARVGGIADGNTRAGAFEISIAYLGQYVNETVLCPSF